MDTLLNKVVHCTILSSLCMGVLSAPALGQNAEIYIIEAGTDPESSGGGPTYVGISGSLGDKIAFEIFVRHIGPDPLTPIRGGALDFPCVAEEGSSGSVEYVRGSGAVNQFRRDYVFFQSGDVGFDESTCPEGNVRFAQANCCGVTDITGLGPRYFGEFSLAVSADASGTFLLPLIGGSGLGNVASQRIPVFLRTLILTDRTPCQVLNAECADSNPCSFDQCIEGVCQHTVEGFRGDVAGEDGSCGPDREVTLSDTIAILNGFQGQFAEGCELINMDIAGGNFIPFCVPDGIIDLYDILAVLDAFQGLDRCCANGR